MICAFSCLCLRIVVAVAPKSQVASGTFVCGRRRCVFFTIRSTGGEWPEFQRARSPQRMDGLISRIGMSAENVAGRSSAMVRAWRNPPTYVTIYRARAWRKVRQGLAVEAAVVLRSRCDPWRDEGGTGRPGRRLEAIAVQLTRHQTAQGARWALDGRLLPPEVSLSALLESPREAMLDRLGSLAGGEPAEGALLPPLDPLHEVWASGVTYLRSREARKAESEAADVYERVYAGERPELFFKAIGWRVVGHGMPIRIRRDASWNVPEPELTLVVNSHLEIVGFCIGNDVSSRDIEGENPLYLPQAKVYNRSCAVGPAISIEDPAGLRDLTIRMEIVRNGERLFHGETRTSQMKRGFEELVAYLGRELDFPQGVFLMTGTGIVPPDEFTLQSGDLVRIGVGSLTLANQVES